MRPERESRPGGNRAAASASFRGDKGIVASTTDTRAVWPRDEFRAAVWASNSLRPLERLVALAYAEHAADKDQAWVTFERLKQCTGLSRDAANRARSGLVEKGWLTLVEPARQHHSARFQIVVPPGQASVSRTTEEDQPSATRTPEQTSRPGDGPLDSTSRPSPDTSRPSPDTSRPGDGRNQSEDQSEDQSSTRAREQAIEQLFARLAPGITRDDATACVSWVAAQGPAPSNLASYVSRFPTADVLDKAARWRGAGSTPKGRAPKCPHGIAHGEKFTGAGANRSRHCPDCQVEDERAAKQRAAS